LSIWFGVGLAIAVYGVASFVRLTSQVDRALPFSNHGFAPLGYNHNQMAEALAIWRSVYGLRSVQDILGRRLALYASILIGLIALFHPIACRVDCYYLSDYYFGRVFVSASW
jgi:hypothetical protein